MASRDKIIANAEKLVAKGKIENAIKEYERLLDDNPNDVNTLNRIGDLWVRINRNDEAVRVFTKIANHYSRDGFFLKAIAIYKKINKLDPSRLEIYSSLAELYAKQGLAMEAKSQYLVLADYYLKQSDPKNALATYTKIAELDPNSINVHVKLADLYSQNGDTAKALSEYDRVGRMLLKRGMTDEAVQVFKKALKIDPADMTLLESLVTAILEANASDAAIQLLETVRSGDGRDPKVDALLGRAYVAKGDIGGAEKILDQAYATHPDDATIRGSLAELALKKDAPDKAFRLLEPRIDDLANNKDPEAVELLQKILRVDSSHIPSLRKLVEVYTQRNEETKILSSMNSVAEACLAKDKFDQAADVLEDLIAREPENAQHREKLAFVRQKQGRGATPVEVPEPEEVAEPAPAAEEPEPEAPSFGVEEGPELSFDLDASPGMDLDLGPGTAAPAPPVAGPETEEDLDFVTEHMTEAEVFAKYGLTDKAIDHLRAVIDRSSRHLPAYDRLLRLYIDEGRQDEAREIGLRYITVLRETGDESSVELVENELTARGISLEEVSSAAAEAVEEVPEEMEISLEEPEEIVVEAAPEEIEVSLEEPEEITIEEVPEEMEISLEEPEEIAVEEPVEVAEEEETEPVAEEAEVEFGELGGEEEEIGLIAETPEEETSLDLEAEETAEAEEPVEAEPEGLFFGVEGEEAEHPTEDELGEIDFYIEQDLLDEARERLAALAARFPDAAEIAERRSRLDEITSRELAPKELSAADIETELLSAIPDDEEELAQVMPPEDSSPAPPVIPETSAQEEENLFAEEDDFFDLASELEEELEEELESDISLSEEEQSLEEVFREFKKGVQEQLDSEDYDTHYNLGIAYKEMGLIDEAIGEFQLASKDPKRAVECCSMLGLCFLEKGMPQLAIKWYRKGLEVPEITEDEHLGLMYELASAHLEVGDTTSAHKAFVEIFGVNSTYRDVAERIRQLENATSG